MRRSEFDLSSIMKEAHRIARIYRSEVGYRKALSWGLKDAWRHERQIIAIRKRDAERAPVSAEASAINDAILNIETKDRLFPSDFRELAILREKARTIPVHA